MASMTALINQELAKIEDRERAFGRRTDPAMDVFKEAWSMGQEQKAWNERKNLQRQQIMSDLTKDTSRLYSNKDAQFQRDRFQKYFDRHKGSMDESTLEMGQMMIGNYDYQIAQNDDFSKYKDGMDSQMQKIDSFLKKPEFEVGKEYTDKEVEEFREVYQGYVDFSEKFMSDHADRLQLAGNSHVLQELSQGSYANKFMLDSFYGDKKIDETEYKAYGQALASNSLEPITKYKEYEKKLISHSNTSLLKSMDDNAELLRNYKLVQEGADMSTVLGKDYAGERYDPDSEEAAMIDDMVISLTDELKEDNKRHIDRHSISYLDQPHMKGLLDPATQPKKTKTKKVSGVNIEDLSNRTKIEFEKAKSRKPDMKIAEFIEHRPDIKESELKTQGVKSSLSNIQDISSKAKKLPLKEGKTMIRVDNNNKQLTENGVNVQYKIKVKDDNDKTISLAGIENLIKKPNKLKTGIYQGSANLENVKLVYEVYKINPYTGKYEFLEDRTDIDNLINKLG